MPMGTKSTEGTEVQIIQNGPEWYRQTRLVRERTMSKDRKRDPRASWWASDRARRRKKKATRLNARKQQRVRVEREDRSGEKSTKLYDECGDVESVSNTGRAQND